MITLGLRVDVAVVVDDCEYSKIYFARFGVALDSSNRIMSRLELIIFTEL